MIDHKNISLSRNFLFRKKKKKKKNVDLALKRRISIFDGWLSVAEVVTFDRQYPFS